MKCEPRPPWPSISRCVFPSGQVQSIICDLKINAFAEICRKGLSIADVHQNKVIGVSAAPNVRPTILKCDLNNVDDISLVQRAPFKRPAERVGAVAYG